MKFLDNAEPFRIKMVEPIKKTTQEEREKLIEEAHYNVFKIKAENVFIDMLTDSGTSAMSSKQWGGIMMGDESYAGSTSFYNLQNSVQDIMGFPMFNPLTKVELLILLCHNSTLPKEVISWEICILIALRGILRLLDLFPLI